MDSTARRLQHLEEQVEELSDDLRVLRSLLSQDHASALNKIRYVAEKILHGMCKKGDISWGKGEPTLENMLGPLRANGVVPKDIAVHLRTVQSNASPGSHFQEHALGRTHVQVAQLALLDVLEWHYRLSGASKPLRPEPVPVAIVTSKKTKRSVAVYVAIGAVGLLTVGILFVATMKRSTPPATPTSVAEHSPAVVVAPRHEPRLGLKALAAYRSPNGSAVTDLNSAVWWRAAADDFADAIKGDNIKAVPVRWQAGHAFSNAYVALLSADKDEAVAGFRKAAELDSTWAEAQAALSVALAISGDTDAAQTAAARAQRLDPDWIGAIAASARVFVRAKQPDRAIQEYQRALKINPDSHNNAVLLAELALVFHASRMDSEALRYAEKALAIDPDMLAVHILFAEQALEKNDGEQALKHAERATASGSRSLAARLALADALALLKRNDEAKAAYQAALKLKAEKQTLMAGERFIAVEAALAKGKLPAPRAAQSQPSRDRTWSPKSPR